MLPAIQTYDNVGASTVREQIDEVQRGHLRGYQAYTISHATDEEWSALVSEAEMQAIDDLKNLQSAAGLFFQAAAHALRGERLPSRLDQQLRFLLASGA